MYDYESGKRLPAVGKSVVENRVWLGNDCRFARLAEVGVGKNCAQ